MSIKAKRIIALTLCIAFAAFLVYAAVAGLGYRLRLERKPYDMGSIAPVGGATLVVISVDRQSLQYSFKNDTENLIVSRGAKLLYQKDGEWYALKSRSVQVAAKRPGASYETSYFSNDLPVERTIDFRSYLGVDEMPAGSYMLLRKFGEVFPGEDGMLSTADDVIREFWAKIEFEIH